MAFLEDTTYQSMDDVRHHARLLGRFRKYTRDLLGAIERNVPGSQRRLLDVGCSIGAMVLEAQARGWQARGIDINENAVRYGREVLGLDVEIARIEDLTSHTQRYHAVTLSQVLEHLVKPHEALRKLFTLLEPGGVVAIQSPNMHGLYARVLGPRWYGYQVGQHLWHFTPRSIGVVASAARARLLEVSTRSSLDYGLPLELSDLPARVFNCGDNVLAVFAPE